MSFTADIRSFLITENVAPANTIFIDSSPSFGDLSDDSILITRTITGEVGTDNPKWARGSKFIRFMIRGRNKTQMSACEAAAYTLYNKLLGHPSVQVGTFIYTQFNASESPRFVGFFQGSEPTYTFVLNITQDSLTDIGNRLAF
jgi:hypothetical protein